MNTLPIQRVTSTCTSPCRMPPLIVPTPGTVFSAEAIAASKIRIVKRSAIFARAGGDQELATELWNRRKGSVLTHDAYTSIGEVTGAIAQRADRTLLALKDSQVVRNGLCRLVRMGDAANSITKQSVSLSDFSEVERVAMMAFVDANLLVIDGDPAAGDARVAVAHEALVRVWPTFTEWLRSQWAELLDAQRLNDAAREWDERRQDPSYLWRGARLERADEISSTLHVPLNPISLVFLRCSRDTQTREEAANQKLRRRSRQDRFLATASIVFVLALSMVATFYLSDELASGFYKLGKSAVGSVSVILNPQTASP